MKSEVASDAKAGRVVYRPFRHLCLKLRVNATLKRRAPCASCCELLTPIVLLGLFGWLSSVFPSNYSPSETYECDTKSLVHGAYVSCPRATQATDCRCGQILRMWRDARKMDRCARCC